MRDAHRMKEKYDLSLDSRQVGSLLIGGIIVLGAVFVLGVVVGKKLATSDKAQSAPDLLSAIDQKADAATYTFQDELTKKPEPAAKKPEPEKKEESKPEPKPTTDKGEKALADAQPPPAADPPEKLADASPEPKAGDPKPEPVATPTPTPTRTLDKDAGLKEAMTRVARPEAAANGAFTLQLSASQSRAEADKFAEKLRDKGYAPFIVRAEVPGRGTWYRVWMGSFASKDAAARYLQDFKRETQLEAFVASNDEKK